MSQPEAITPWIRAQNAVEGIIADIDVVWDNINEYSAEGAEVLCTQLLEIKKQTGPLNTPMPRRPPAEVDAVY